MGRSFFSLVRNTLKRIHKANPEESLRISDSALDVYAKSPDPTMNLPYHLLAQQRYACWNKLEEQEKGAEEMQALKTGLEKRGVNPSVLSTIEPLAVPKKPARQAKRRSPRKTPKRTE